MDLAHVILHVAFCAAISRAPSGTSLALQVQLTDRTGRTHVQTTYHVERGDENQAIVEFDSGFGIYRLDVAAPKYRCSATDYLVLISGHTRSITETLANPPAPPPKPVLLSGTAPQSFLYVQPTFMLFDKSQVTCNKPMPQPLQAQIVVENDQDGYYTWLYGGDSAAPDSQQLVLRLRTPTHAYHYVRIPMTFPMPWRGWPESIQLNVTEDMVDGLAGEPFDTLLCPKFWKTSAG